jgi:pimeloyl-ACP methyl ester carboxylesterase
MPDWLDTAEYPFTPRRLRLSAGEVSCVDEGHGPPILFVHGTPTWSFDWRFLIKELSGTHRCVAPDLLGFGLSEKPAGFGYRPEDHASVIRELIEQLDLREFTLVVHDFGGPIGLSAYPERAKRLVLFNTWMWGTRDDKRLYRMGKIVRGPLGKLLYRGLNVSPTVIAPSAFGDKRKFTPKLKRHWVAPFPDWQSRIATWKLGASLAESSEWFASLWEQRERLRGKPTLLLWGMKDTAFRAPELERWQKFFGDSADTVRFETAGHWPHEEEPERVEMELQAFLEAHP